MSEKLAVFTNDFGASFIDFHIRDVVPGKAVAVGRYGTTPLSKIWRVDCPALLLDQWELKLQVRLSRKIGRSMAKMRARAIKRFLRQHNVSVALGEYLDQFLEYVPILEKMRIPYVVQAHGYDVSAKLREPGMTSRIQVYENAKAILTRSEFHRRRLIELGLPAERIHVNFGGVRVPIRPPVRDSTAGKRLLAIGVMVPKKGPMYLLEAFRRAAELDPEITLDYVGGGQLFSSVLQYVRATGLTDRVKLHGFVPQAKKQGLIERCGVFVQHSITNQETGDEEGLPAAIQEAMAHGMAVVSTRHSGIPEAVIENETGLLVDEGDVDAMAQAFVDIGSIAEEFGKNGYQQAVTKHAWCFERDRLRGWLLGGRT